MPLYPTNVLAKLVYCTNSVNVYIRLLFMLMAYTVVFVGLRVERNIKCKKDFLLVKHANFVICYFIFILRQCLIGGQGDVVVMLISFLVAGLNHCLVSMTYDVKVLYGRRSCFAS